VRWSCVTLPGMSTTRALATLAPFVRAQFGLITTRQLLRALDSRGIDRLVAAGLLVRLYRGVYRCELYQQSWQQRALAEQFGGGANGALSHGAAAKILQLEHAGVGRSPTIELTFPRHVRLPKLDVPMHESIYLCPERHVVRRGPFRVTSSVWTVGALASRRSVQTVEKMIDALVAANRATIEEFHELAGLLWKSPGVVNLRLAVQRHLPEGRLTRSEAERLFLRILRDAGLALPVANVRVVDAAGRVRYLDFAYADLRIMIEIDVHPDHGRTLGRNADGARQNDLVPAWHPLRFDESDLLYRPGEVADQVRRALRDCGAAIA